MRIKDITDFQLLRWMDITSNANKVHPKFFSILNYNDVLSDEYDYSKINTYYVQVVIDLINESRNEIESMIDLYKQNLVEDAIGLFETCGFNSKTASEVTEISNYDSKNFIPAPEIYDLYKAADDILDNHRFIPFWERNISINDGIRIYKLNAASTAQLYIENARVNISVGSQNINEVIINAVHDIDSMPSFFIKQENVSSVTSPFNAFAKAVNRHKVLYSLKEQLKNKTIQEEEKYISKVDLNGNITFRGEKIYEIKTNN